MKPTVFILEGNFLGLEMARELRDEGYPIVVIGHDKSDIAIRARGVVGKILPLPSEQTQTLLDGLIELAKEVPGPKVLMGASDGYRRWVSHNIEGLTKYFKMLPCPVDEIDALLDKWNQMQMAVSAGIPIPKSTITGENGDMLNNLEYPVIIKPRFSNKSIRFRDSFGGKVFLAQNDQQFESICQKVKSKGFKPLIQEMIPGVDYNQFLFGAAVKDGIPYAICMTQKLKADPQPYGSGVIIRTIYHQELYDAGLKMLKHMKYSGICDIEFMRNWDTGEFQFIEFNPRYGLGQRVSQKAGNSLANTAVNLAMGNIPRSMSISDPGFYWVYFDEWAKEIFIPWRNSFLRLLRNSNNTARIFDHSDFRPELRHILNIMNLKLKRPI
jgi:predicted ATP-grasp superfamily ATP-dependent carboligase